MKIGICSDKTKQINLIKNMLENQENIQNAEINVFSSDEFVEYLEEKEADLDIAVLEIEFDEQSFDGIYFGKKLNQRFPDCQIIYVNDSGENSPDVYETRHCYCIRAGDVGNMLPKAIEKAMELIGATKAENSLSIACNGHMVYILKDDIKYIEKVARTVKIHTDDAVYNCYMTLSNICRKIEGGVERSFGATEALS
ncbi:MAG: LytTR family transcriptional regulator DNA-binding domain-containing protein [Bacteroides sp.]|nr:LytTR family transcriptional regulator DNA-binding domain-containing protein [Bacteroides sp.]